MKKRTNLIIKVSMICLLTMALRMQALSCTCGPTTLNDKLYGLSEMIIVGEIIETKNEKLGPNEMLLLRIKVDKVWKQKAERTIWVPLMDMKGWCGDMDVLCGKKYFFRAIKFRGGAAILGDCGASRFLDSATEDLKYLSKKPGWSY